MPDVTTQSMDDVRMKTTNEVIQVIDDFLEISDRTSRKENIADYVYFFFAPHGVDVGAKVFSTAAASALCVFSTSKKIRNHLRKIYGNDFYFLCELLQKVVEFCNNIRSSEANLARLNKSKWECDDTIHLSIEDVQEEKTKYEHKLQNLKERIRRIKKS